MKILALDPSSVAVGWAIFVDDRLVKPGVFKASGDFIKRMKLLMECTRELVMVYAPDLILIEMHEGLPFARNQRSDKEKRSPKVTATLCHGQGMILGAIVHCTAEIKIVGDLEWTAQHKKEVRAKDIHMIYPAFRDTWERDDGMDAADAVGIGMHWINGESMRRLESVPGAKILRTNIKGEDE
jgi:Holliday junction resolvasome RuvABC endonuclease subunit